MRVRTRLMIGYVLVLTILVTIGLTAFISRMLLVERLDQLAHVAKEIDYIQQLSIKIEQLLMPANDYLISGDPIEKEKYDRKYMEFVDDNKFIGGDEKPHSKFTIALMLKIKELDKKAQAIFSIPSKSLNVSRTKEIALMYEMDKVGEQAYNIINDHAITDRGELDIILSSSAKTLVLINWILGLGVMFVIIIMAFFIRYLDHTIRAPIESLSEKIRGVSQGRWTKIELNDSGEFSNLAEEFNVMVGRLSNFYDELEDKVKYRTEQLDTLNHKLKNLAVKDGLTGLYNHRYFYEKLKEEFTRVKRYGKTVVLLMIDIDHFKQYNDEFGHVAGDFILKEVAANLQKESRETDTVARYGGEEFVIIAPEMLHEQALPFAERVRALIADSEFKNKQILTGKSLTISIGVGVYPGDGDTYDELIQAADKALYRAKESGRNKVVAASSNP
ncbi:MAG: diguanylate cyclase [Leptospirales bacterium]